jgi:hypothetical protein
MAIRADLAAETALVHSPDPPVRDRARQLHAGTSPIANPIWVRSDDVGNWRVGNVKNSRQKAPGSEQQTTFAAICFLPPACYTSAHN